MVKSNSLRATKSMAFDAFSVASGSTATLAPIMPIFRFGLSALSASAVLHIGGERRSGRMQHHEIVFGGVGRDVLEFQPVRRRIDELRAFDQRGGLRQPRRIPERLDLAARLIARARAAVETVERRRLQEESSSSWRVRSPISNPTPARDHAVAVAFPAHVPAEKARNEENERQ